MKRILFLFGLLLVSVLGMAQAPSSYTNINGRYRWIAGMFDSTFHIPKGTTPSLRTGGSTNSGALFYKTGDSSLYVYSGTQWLKIAGASGFVPYTGATQNVNLNIYSLLAKSLAIADTSGIGADIQQRTSLNTDIALNVKATGNRGYAAIIDQADSVAAGTQYQTVFRKGMMPGTGNPSNGGSVAWITQVGNDNSQYMTTSVYRSRLIDTSGYAAGSGAKSSSIELWTRKNNAFDTTLVLNAGNVGVNTGQNGIDSSLTVANGTWLKRGVRMSALPSGVGTKALRVDASGTLSLADTLTNGVSGTGTTNYIPKFTSSNTIGNSLVFDDGTTVYANGGIRMNGYMTMLSSGFTRGFLGDINGDGKIQLRSEKDLLLKSGGDNLRITIDSSGKVGVGAGSPDSLFTVFGSTNLQGGVRMSGLPTGVGTKALRINASGTLSIADTLANGISGTGTTNYIPKFTSSSAIGNSLLFDNGTSIGFGTTSPNVSGFGRALTISSTNSGLELTSATNVVQGTVQSNSNGLTLEGIGTAGMRFFTSASGATSERMRLDASGNLGLGVTPSAWSLYQAIQVQAASIANFNTSDNSIVGSNVYYGGSPTDFRYISTGTSTMYRLNGGVHSFYTAPSGTAGNAISFTQAMTLDASGNLGIGSTSPAYKFHAVSSSTSIGAFRNSGAANGQLLVGNTAGDLALRILASGDALIFSDVSKYLAFGTSGGSERMRLDASGNLGLGVTPSAWTITPAFQVRRASIYNDNGGGTYISTNGYYDAAWKYIGTGYATQYYQLSGQHVWRYAPSGTAGNTITFTQAMTLDASGNLGLGTTSPVSVGSGSTTMTIASASTKAATLQLQGNGTTGNAGGFQLQAGTDSKAYIWNYQNTDLIVATNASERMRITSGGNVLVGTTTDAGYKLDVAGSLRTTSTTVLGYNTTVGNASFSWGFPGSYFGQMQNISGTVYGLGFGSGTSTNGTTVLSYNTSGNVGIGTTSPSERLHVVGRTLITDSSQVPLTLNNTGQRYTQQDFHINGVQRGSLWVDGTGTSFNMYTPTSWDLVFWAGATERMRITSGGNVGIGTTSPATPLAVKGSANNTLIEMGNSSTNSAFIQAYDRTSSVFRPFVNYAELFTWETGGSERMRITSGGNILMGTTTDVGAGYRLQVNGSVLATSYYESSDLRLKNVFYENRGSDGINTIRFKWKDGRDSLTHIGYAAQQVEKVLPDAVKTNSDGYKTVNYDEVQTLKIMNLEQEVAELKALIKKLMK